VALTHAVEDRLIEVVIENVSVGEFDEQPELVVDMDSDEVTLEDSVGDADAEELVDDDSDTDGLGETDTDRVSVEEADLQAVTVAELDVVNVSDLTGDFERVTETVYDGEDDALGDSEDDTVIVRDIVNERELVAVGVPVEDDVVEGEMVPVSVFDAVDDAESQEAVDDTVGERVTKDEFVVDEVAVVSAEKLLVVETVPDDEAVLERVTFGEGLYELVTVNVSVTDIVIDDDMLPVTELLVVDEPDTDAEVFEEADTDTEGDIVCELL
jgi:hypothetical protein